jgi:hypothetical protein
VWETREVRQEVNHTRFISFYLLPLLLTNVKNALGHALPTHVPHKTSHNGNTHPSIDACTGTSHPTPPFSCMPAQMLVSASVRLAWSAIRGLVCHVTSSLEPTLAYAAQANARIIVGSNHGVESLNGNRPNARLTMPNVTSQRRMAMSIDIRSAVARFLGQFHGYTHMGWEYPRVSLHTSLVPVTRMHTR